MFDHVIFFSLRSIGRVELRCIKSTYIATRFVSSTCCSRCVGAVVFVASLRSFVWVNRRGCRAQ